MEGRKTSKPFRGFNYKPKPEAPKIEVGDRVTYPGGKGVVIEVYKSSAWLKIKQQSKVVKALMPLWILKHVHDEEYFNG